jgi:hypothetical protein
MSDMVGPKLAASLLAVVLAGGCAGPQTPRGPRAADEVDIGLRRGAAWTTFTLKRNRIIGATVGLEIKRGDVVGFIDGGAVRLKVTSEEVSGSFSRTDGVNPLVRPTVDMAGPTRGADGGRVQIDIDEHDGMLEISGTWGSDRVRLEVSPENLNGTISGRTLGQCQYVLDKTDQDGVRSGTSICSGLPEPTRLIFPKDIERWLTRGEAVAVLLALLSSPPPTSGDAF